MLLYKKRLRLYATYLNCTLDYTHSSGFRIQHKEHLLEIETISRTHMQCAVTTPQQTFQFQTQKIYVFDILEMFTSEYWLPKLNHYSCYLQPYTIGDYIREEDGAEWIAELREKVQKHPHVSHDLGGNRILAKYATGILILSDDLCVIPTNVFDFPE
jgi:hypothetical protein